MRRSWLCRLLPRYYEQLLRNGAARKHAIAASPAAGAATTRRGSSNSRHHDRRQQQQVQQRGTRPRAATAAAAPPPRRVRRTSAVYVTHVDASLQRTVALAQTLLQQWHDAHATRRDTTSSTDAARVRNYVEFVARRDVFAVLRCTLPPPSVLPSLAATTGGSGCTSNDDRCTASSCDATAPRRGLVVVPDDVVDAFDGDAAATTTATTTDETHHACDARLTLEQLTMLLELYAVIDSDDGVVLRQLLDEVHRFVTCNLTRETEQQQQQQQQQQQRGVTCRGGGAAVARDVHLPLPALLTTLSQLRVVDERTLLCLTREPPPRHARQRNTTAAVDDIDDDDDDKDDDGRRRRRGDGGGVLYAQLPLYNGYELLALLVALCRFGMQQHTAFARTCAALRRRLLTHATCRDFCREMRRIEQQRRGSNDDSDTSSSSSTAWLAALPTLLSSSSMRYCTVAMLVEVLTALSVSSFRSPALLQFVADVLVVRACAQLSRAHSQQHHDDDNNNNNNGDDDGRALHVLSHQLLRAAQLCECAEAPAPLLADAFAHCCTVAGKGVLVDGGEDADAPSDRVAYYDHVTADLVKLPHVAP